MRKPLKDVMSSEAMHSKAASFVTNERGMAFGDRLALRPVHRSLGEGGSLLAKQGD